MSDIIGTVNRLPKMEHSTSASEEQFFHAEEILGLCFSEEYRQYLSAFGAAWSDIIAISGITDDDAYSVVSLTNRLRKVNPGISPTFYAIEDVGVDGLVIWQDHTGSIYQSIPNHPAVKVFESLSAFLNYQLED